MAIHPTILGQHPMMKDWSEDLLALVQPCAEELHFERGQLIFRQGKPADALFLVLEGHVALEQHVPGRGTLQVETLHEGDVLGLSWLFPGAQWTLDARAVEPARVIRFDAERLRGLMHREPRVALPVTTFLNARLYDRLQRVRLQRFDVYRTEA